MTKEIKKHQSNNLIYIIDNYSVNFQTDRIKNLVGLFRQKIPQCSVKVIHYSQLDMEILKSSKGIILTGSEINVSEFYDNKVLRKKFKSVLKLIKKAKNIPILAICYGLHLTGFAFNGKVYRMNIPHDIQHRDFILPDDPKIQRKFEILATKVLNGFNTIQYMRHINRPIYSVQFHPETHLENYTYRNEDDEELIKKAKQCGEEIIINFANICNQ
jgi:GMP synthase-like glutamine amidotransferase